MQRAFLFLGCCAVAVCQVRQNDPFESVLQAYSDAREQGNFGEAATRRDAARAMVSQTPVESPEFLGYVQRVQQLYQNSGRRLQARTVVQDALARANSLGDSHPVRIQLLDMLADSWQGDGNLLKALSYREQAVAAIEAAPPSVPQGAAAQPAAQFTVARIGISRSPWFQSGIRSFRRIGGTDKAQHYQQLADLYQQLGRPDAAAKAIAKERSLIQDDPGALAALDEREGNIDAAVALYKKQAEQAAANSKAQPWEVIGPLQSMASLYQREERWDEAAAAWDQAARLAPSSAEAMRMRLNLANLLQQAGRNQAAEQLYKILLSERAQDADGTQVQVLQVYANYLGSTNRAGQGEDLLKSYLSNHANLQPGEEANILSSLSQVASLGGKAKLADEYRRAADEKQRATQPQQKSDHPLIGRDLERAQAAVNEGHLDEGVSLASQAIASASHAQDREQIAWQVPSIASALAFKEAPEKGEQLYQELFTLLQAWSVDNVSPLLQALQQYAHTLIGQPDRRAGTPMHHVVTGLAMAPQFGPMYGSAAGTPAVIARYRETLIAAGGTDTVEFEQAIRLQAEFARASGTQAEAGQAAEELLAHSASLSGTTSRPYMDAARTATEIFQSSGQPERALELHRQIVAIAEQALPAKDPERAFVRMNAAHAFANAQQFDEAERLASEAVALVKDLRSVQADGFVQQLDQIRQQKAAAAQRFKQSKYY